MSRARTLADVEADLVRLRLTDGLEAGPPAQPMADLEADLARLRSAAERAGTALACLFSSSDEFHAAVIKARRDAGAFRHLRKRHRWGWFAATAGLSALFLML
jgi:hypothetical protein